MQLDTRTTSNGSASSNLAFVDCAGLRRSSRLTTPKKNNILTPSSTRKSAPVTEKTPLKPSPRTKAEEQEELPLRRSSRANVAPSSRKSEKSLNGTNSSNTSGNRKRSGDSPMEVHDGDHNLKKKKQLNARSYRALFNISDTSNGSDDSPGSQSGAHCLGENEDANNESEDLIGDLVEHNNERTSEMQRVSDPSPMNFCSDGDSAKAETEQANRLFEAQTDNKDNTCIICKLPGKLLCCQGTGCGKRGHSSCIDPTLKDLHPGGWYCPLCVRKKIEAGVYSVSDGVESILNAREVNVQKGEDGKQKQYFIKYKGLAHVHNLWVAESQLEGNPELVSKFIQQEEAVCWRPEWTVPDRLLHKRSIKIPDGELSPKGGGNINSNEWLVKWRGLDYSHVTWELENASFLRTSHALDLIKGYELRHDKTRKEASVDDEIQAKKKGSSTKLPKLQTAVDSNLNVDNLCGYLRRRHNLVLIDEEDQIARTVHLISFVQSDVSRPFLIIAPSGVLLKWEAEFLQSAASTNVVVYGGNKEAREIIRTVEFYGEDNCIMFQVLLSSHDTVTEDLDLLECIKWEAIVLDQCHNSHILANSSFVKQLNTDWTLLLMSEQINENVADYCHVFSLLNLGDTSPDLCSVNELKEKLSPFIIRECKPNVSRFVEYWVPAEVSNVQLEQYCSSLLSDSVVLCSKTDPLDNLPKTLLCARKCCDHPYIVNPKLQHSLIQGHLEELVDIGIRASGKLQLLDAILSEVRSQGLRVLVLFQAVAGAGRDSLGDILEDFVRERYGTDSYERIDGCEIHSRKQTALNKFNSHKTRFIFLLDTRACSPIIKLQSVDCTIIFNSDWNPLTDLKALQKIKIDTKRETMNVFRLYTTCTIDEKVLILSKNGWVLDNTMQTVNWNTGHSLLMWGASYLFRKLDAYHDSDVSSRTSRMLPMDLIFKNVVQEFSSLLQRHGGGTIDYKFISKATMKGGCYSRDISLAGERIIDLEDEELPSPFWEKLLKGRQPRWRHLPVLSSQRSRKRIQNSEGLSTMNVQNDESSKRPKVVGSADLGPCVPKTGTETVVQPFSACAGASGSALKSSSQSANEPSAVLGGKQRLLEEQKSLHQDLRPVMTKLFEILGLQEEVKEMAERFLKYVINNHRVTREPETILQAFEISVCWVAASLLGQKINQKDSLKLARKHLNFSCDDSEADYTLSKTRSLSELFLIRSGDRKGLRSPREGNLGSKSLTRDAVSRDSWHTPMQTSPVSKGGLTEKDDKIREHEVHKLKKSWEEKKAELEKNYHLDSLVIKSIHPTPAICTEKLKNLDDQYAQKCLELDSEMATRLRNLESCHQYEKLTERVNRADSLLAELNPVVLDKLPSAEAGVTREILQVVEDNELEVVSDVPRKLQGGQRSIGDPSSAPGVQGNLPVITEGHSSMKEVDYSELPGNEHNSNYPAEPQKSNKVIPADEATTLDNVQVEGSHGLNINPAPGGFSPEVERHGEARPVLLQSPENHVNEALGNLPQMDSSISSQMATAGQCDGAAKVGHGPSSGLLLTPISISQSHANPSEGYLMAVDQSRRSNASNDCIVDNQQVNAEAMSSKQACVTQSGDSRGAGKEHGISDGTAQAVPSSVAPAEPSHASLPSSREPEHQVAQDNPLVPGISYNETVQAVPTSVASDERRYPALPSSSEPWRLLAQDNPLHPGLSYNEAVQAVRTSVGPDERSQPCLPSSSDPQRQPAQDNNIGRPNPCSAHLPGLHYPTENPTARSLPAASEVRGRTPSVGLPLPPRSAGLPDPLQNVLEKIQKQMDQSNAKYTETKSRLETERAKEIADVLAQIRQKYELQAQEAEASYLQQKEEHVRMHAIIRMNKRLAEEFRCKCVDFRAAQAAPSHMIQQQQRHPTYTSRRVQPPPHFGSAPLYRPPVARIGDHHAAPSADIHSRYARPPQTIPQVSTSGQFVRAPSATSHQRLGSTSPAPTPPSMSVQPLNNVRPSMTLPPLPEIARHFDSWNLSGFDTMESPPATANGPPCRSNDEQQQAHPSQADASVVCLSDDE